MSEVHDEIDLLGSDRGAAPADDAVPDDAAFPAHGEAAQATSYDISDSIVMLSDRKSLPAESIALLVSELISRHIQSARRGVTFCAASSGTGCSYIAANVAVAMALSGIRTLLIDANLRSPAIGDYIRPSHDRGGLIQALETPGMAWQDAIHEGVIPHLSVLYSGGQVEGAGLLASTRAKDILSDALRDYQCTIVDTAPANISSDAVRVANVVRYALVVARKDHTYVSDIKKLVADIRQNRGEVLGTYLNDY